MWPLTANHVIAGSRLATLSGRCALDVSASNRPTAQTFPESSDRTRAISSSLPVTLDRPACGLLPPWWRSMAERTSWCVPTATNPGSTNDTAKLALG